MKESERLEKISTKEFYALSKWVFSLYLKLNPVYTILNIFFTAYFQLEDLIYALIFAKTLDQLILVVQDPNASLVSMTPYIAVLFAFNLTQNVLKLVQTYFKQAFRETSRLVIEEAFYNRLKNLGIQTLEQPEVNNKLQRTAGVMASLYDFIQYITDIIAAVVRLGSAFVVLFTALPMLAPIMLIFSIPAFFVDKHYRTKLWHINKRTTEDRRKAQSSLNDITSSKSLQEILITGSFNFLSEKFKTFTLRRLLERLALRKKWYSISVLLAILDNLVYFFGVIQIIQNLLSHVITVGSVTFHIRALTIFQSSIVRVAQIYNNMYDFSFQVKETYDLYTMEPSFQDGTIELPKLSEGPQITIRNLNFKYSGSEKYVFKDLNLNIKPKEKIAIVGPNGAGKTTLIKLICRMYKLDEGEILINGTNINDLKLESLYQNIGLLFQDFNHYPQLSAKENIFIGNTSIPVDEEKLLDAANNADAHEFITDFKKGYDQILSERYKDGIRPSTGQWQKLAIARFFYRNAPVVIFDEPTAAIDAVSEYNIFNKIYKFFKDKTVIIISHRFSTVRNADRIIVLEHGKIVEEGTHAKLMENNGEYAKAFTLQAQGYLN